MTETDIHSTPLRRLGDEPASERHRIGVLWCADATTSRHKVWSTVLDISPEGAKLKVDTNLLGAFDTFRLEVESLSPIQCTPVWQQDGQLGVRFLDGQPSMTQLQKLLTHPPYLPAAA